MSASWARSAWAWSSAAASAFARLQASRAQPSIGPQGYKYVSSVLQLCPSRTDCKRRADDVWISRSPLLFFAAARLREPLAAHGILRKRRFTLVTAHRAHDKSGGD